MTVLTPGHCILILYGRLEASQPHLPASNKTKTQASVTDLQNKFVKLKQRGIVRPQNLRKCMKFNWNFQRVGGGGLEKIPSLRKVSMICFWNYTILWSISIEMCQKYGNYRYVIKFSGQVPLLFTPPSWRTCDRWSCYKKIVENV